MLASLLIAATVRPNFVVILCDDLGYGDLSCYGNKNYATPNLDQMAKEGVRFTACYAASPACSPSRAALLTACYPTRVGVPQVLNPDSRTGLNPNEWNLARGLKEVGYATAAIGKWHLGVKNLSPNHQGFDQFFGLPYSHDMWPPNKNGTWPDLYLYQDSKPIRQIKTGADASHLTQLYTEKSLRFIEENRSKPFLLYLAHSMPHVPVFPSKKFVNRTKRGPYADCVAEIDDSTGQILRKLELLNLAERTMVVFTSDNGPWLPYGDHAGSSGGLREGKGTTFEGGVRVPGIFYWKGKFASGKVSDSVVSLMDITPTAFAYAGAKQPQKAFDGKVLRPLLESSTYSISPHSWLYFYWPDELQAIRSGAWKFHAQHKHRQQSGPPGKNGAPAGETIGTIGESLFDLSSDPREKLNVAADHPRVVERLRHIMNIGRRELGDSITKTVGAESREPGRVN